MDKKYVTYEDFGAVGDGVTDDFVAIKLAHDYANEMGLPVKARDEANYYIHYNKIDGVVESAIIKTPTDWGDAHFTIDDRDISPVKGDETFEYSHTRIFEIPPIHKSIRITDRELLSRIEAEGLNPESKKINLGLGYDAMIMPYSQRLEDRVYRRRGYGPLALGAHKREVIVIDKDGNIDPDTKVLFDYPHIDYIEVYRCDDEPLTVKGGIFTTRTSTVNTLRDMGDGTTSEEGGYITRGIRVFRSNVTISGVRHYVTDSISLRDQIKNGDYVHISSTYGGFYLTQFANNVTFADCVMTGRRCHGRPKNCRWQGTGGTYDFMGNCSNKLTLKNCVQSNFWVRYDEELNIYPCEENDEGAVSSIQLKHIEGLDVKVFWGVCETDFCKNMEYNGCTLSRFDAHMGMYNGKLINSSVNILALTGAGTMQIENVKWFASDPLYIFNALLHFREDYGSTWEGDVIIKNVKAYFFNNENISICYHRYSNWNYGYKCALPNINIDGFEAFYIDTRKPLPEGSLIKLIGSTPIKEPAMHLAETKNTEAVYPYVDFDGDGLVDGTNVPYDAEAAAKSMKYSNGVLTGSKKNLNVIGTPDVIKVKNLRGGVKISVPKTSAFEDLGGGFFGKTRFYYNDEDYYYGTDYENTETFSFDNVEDFKNIE